MRTIDYVIAVAMMISFGCQPGAECMEDPGMGVRVVCADGSGTALCESDGVPDLRQEPECDERTAEASCPEGFTLVCFE